MIPLEGSNLTVYGEGRTIKSCICLVSQQLNQ